jgi:hypothetical protein
MDGCPPPAGLSFAFQKLVSSAQKLECRQSTFFEGSSWHGVRISNPCSAHSSNNVNEFCRTASGRRYKIRTTTGCLSCKLLNLRGGSPAWIRTTIHGSKGRCPTIRRPGIGLLRSSVYHAEPDWPPRDVPPPKLSMRASLSGRAERLSCWRLRYRYSRHPGDG